MDEVAAFAPGRVNLVGEHTDYNEGLALPLAIGAGVSVRAWRLDGGRVVVRALDLDEGDEFRLDGVEAAAGWRGFVRGAVGELRRAGVAVPGARLEITGDVPRGAGLGSSAALSVALVLALRALAGSEAATEDRLATARLCSRVENDWVGAQTGLLDQLAALYGEPGHALRIDFRSLEVRPVALKLGGHRLVMLDSGERHDNAAGGYNRRRAECRRACQLLGVESLRDAGAQDIPRLPEPLDRRLRHLIGSNRRVDAAVEAVAGGDRVRLGELLDESHASLRDDYEISTPAVEAAVAALKRAGALGARVHGGGFGGHVLGLMPPDTRGPEGAVEVVPGGGRGCFSPDSSAGAGGCGLGRAWVSVKGCSGGR